MTDLPRFINPNNPLFNDNRLKLGVFGFNGQAPSSCILDELYTPTCWSRILEIGAAADTAGFEAVVPFARWKHGRSRDASNPAAMEVFDPFVWAAGLGQATRYPAVMATSHMSLLHPIIAAKQSKSDVDAYRDLATRDFARHIQVWTVAYVIPRETQSEAEAYHQRILDNADHRANDAMMAMLGAQSKMMSKEAFQAFRNRYIAGAGGFPIVGTSERIVDTCGRLSAAGVDGLLLCWIDYVDGLARWTQKVMPTLEQAGLRRPFSPQEIH